MWEHKSCFTCHLSSLWNMPVTFFILFLVFFEKIDTKLPGTRDSVIVLVFLGEFQVFMKVSKRANKAWWSRPRKLSQSIGAIEKMKDDLSKECRKRSVLSKRSGWTSVKNATKLMLGRLLRHKPPGNVKTLHSCKTICSKNEKFPQFPETFSDFWQLKDAFWNSLKNIVKKIEMIQVPFYKVHKFKIEGGYLLIKRFTYPYEIHH